MEEYRKGGMGRGRPRIRRMREEEEEEKEEEEEEADNGKEDGQEIKLQNRQYYNNYWVQAEKLMKKGPTDPNLTPTTAYNIL